VIALIFAALYGIGKALSDLSAEGKIYPKSNSWKNKWLLDKRGNVMPTNKKLWYYPINSPLYTERFPYSSTFFVAFTDFWHRCETLKAISLVLTALAYSVMVNHIIDFIMLYASWNIAFSIVYETIKRKKCQIKKQ